MKALGNYKNGNYKVAIFEDGTKVRWNDLDNLTPEFAESMDIKLTDKCSVGCKFCYEGCTPGGKHSDILSQEWIKTLHPWTEVAINGNDLDHPQLSEFLDLMKSMNVIVNMTLNKVQFIKNRKLVDSYLLDKKIYGLGISISENINQDLLEILKQYPNVVVHTIAGLLTPDILDMDKLQDLKILILGYKYVGRGKDYKDRNSDIDKNIKWLKNNIVDFLKSGKLGVCSFDNLAINQLDLENQIKTKTNLRWDEIYMGDDGDYSFYIDAVSQTYALNSTISKDKNYPIMNKSVDEMFNSLKKND